jgi:hypothetical protein
MAVYQSITKLCARCGESKELSSFPLCRGQPRARCKPCHTQDAREWAQKNHAQYTARLRSYYRATKGPVQCLFPPMPDHIRKERAAKSRKAWTEANKERFDKCRAEWAAKNKHVSREVVRRRQVSKRNASVVWANRAAMQAFYKEAKRLTELTGQVHQVDHIVPITSKIVCGLHCEANLQVLLRSENLSKGNRVWPDMP